MRRARVRARAGVASGLLLAVLACGEDERRVTVEVTGSARADWRSAVAPCFDASWDWRVEPLNEPGQVRITVPADQYDATRTLPLITCLEKVSGVTRADVPARVDP